MNRFIIESKQLKVSVFNSSAENMDNVYKTICTIIINRNIDFTLKFLV